MYPERSDQHFSDEALIRHADGEGPWWEERRVRRHLLECWRCRTRLTELGRQTERVATLLRDEVFPEPVRLAEARLRLAERQRWVESRLAEETWRRAAARRLPLSRASRIAASLVVASALGLGFWIRFSNPRPPAPSPAVRQATHSAPVSKPARAGISEPRLRPRPIAPQAVWMELPPVLKPRAAAALELDLLLALHAVDACSGEPVELAPDGEGGFTVSGAVRDAARREEIAAAVAAAGVPGVRVALQSMDEAAAAAPPEGETHPAPVDEYRTGTTPFERLAGGTLSREQVIALSNAAVGAAEATMAQAWAIRRLEERFPRERLALLDNGDREVYGSMLEDHLRRLGAALARLRGVTQPVLDPLADGGRAQREPAPLDNWFETVRRGAELTRRFFAGGAPAAGGDAELARESLEVVSRLEAGWEALSARLAAKDGNLAVKGANR